ncbi:MAG: extracellular solute-binding protein [Clostridiales bacterium]|nr:extracellular solute-binding protein [Clostridiales bacterium]
MVTIKDIAKAAGVAQGTVSNVLNGRGNVSSEKIRHVLTVSEKLGYIPNERAKLLRKGHTNVLGVLLPSLDAKGYSDFFLSFKTYAEDHGYTVRLYLPRQGSPEAEEQAVQEARSDRVMGMAIFSSCLHLKGFNPFQHTQSSDPKMLFVERKPHFEADYLGFSYSQAGSEMAQKALEKGFSTIGLLTGNLNQSHEAEFYQAFMKTMEGSSCTVLPIQTDDYRKYQNILQAFDFSKCQALFVSHLEFAQSAKNVLDTFSPTARPVIYTLSPMFTMPEKDYQKYELNYRLMGNTAAKSLIRQAQDGEASGQARQTLLENVGFRNWYAHIITPAKPRPINVLTLDSPTAYIMRNMAQLYTKHTGVPVNITIYSYDEIYEAFNNLREDSIFDVLRLDVTWLSWFAEKILLPMDEVDPHVADDFSGLLAGITDKYSYINGKLYAMPSTPSTQLLFYRRDLFENSMYRRMYQEQYKTALVVPRTFEEYNRVAAFFTRAVNPASPVEYGATLTLGSTGVAGAEYLARLFALQENLYDDSGRIVLNSPNAIRALEQIMELKRFTNPQYCNWWTHTAAEFARGDVAMAILYYNFASGMLSHSSRVADSIGYALPPGGRPVIGGGTLGISRFSTQPEQALRFIRWNCSEPIASASTLLGGVSPCKLSYDNYEIINNFPWFKLVAKSFAAAKGSRIPRQCNLPFDERRFMSIIGMAVKNAYSGAQNPLEAMNYAQKLFDEQFAGHVAELARHQWPL